MTTRLSKDDTMLLDSFYGLDPPSNADPVAIAYLEECGLLRRRFVTERGVHLLYKGEWHRDHAEKRITCHPLKALESLSRGPGGDTWALLLGDEIPTEPGNWKDVALNQGYIKLPREGTYGACIMLQKTRDSPSLRKNLNKEVFEEFRESLSLPEDAYTLAKELGVKSTSYSTLLAGARGYKDLVEAQQVRIKALEMELEREKKW